MVDSAPFPTADRGAVTVEAAIALSAIVLVFGLVVGGLSTVTDQLRCIDAAREVARLVARGQEQNSAEVVHKIAPDDAQLEVRRDGESIDVYVRINRMGMPVHGHAHAMSEPGLVFTDAR